MRSQASADELGHSVTSLGLTRQTAANTPSPECFLNDLEASHIIKIIFAALMASVPDCTPVAFRNLVKLRASGRVVPTRPDDNSGPEARKLVEEILRTTYALEDAMAIDLATRICRAVATRFCLSEALTSRTGKPKENAATSRHDRKKQVISRIMCYATLDELPMRITASGLVLPTVRNAVPTTDKEYNIIRDSQTWHVLLEWLRTVILKEWDGKPWIPRCSAMTGALELLRWICKLC